MNNTFETIYSRRAVRKYKPKKVDRDLIEQILEAGRMAPSAHNNQPWKFYMLTDKDDIQTFSKAIRTGIVKGILKMGFKRIVKLAFSVLHFPGGGDLAKAHDMIFYGAPAVIFITSPKDNEWAGLDVGMCAQNMMLAAKSLGLDSCPVGSAKYVEETKLFSKLRIPAIEQVDLALVVGYGDETPAVHERVKNNLIYIN